MDWEDYLEKIRSLITQKLYRVKIHTIRHMVEEGFSENDIITAILDVDGKILEYYQEDRRCLIFGKFLIGGKTKLPLHVICDFSTEKFVDIVTAYIPQKPWWISPLKRGKRI
jgi:hypothetical protein